MQTVFIQVLQHGNGNPLCPLLAVAERQSRSYPGARRQIKTWPFKRRPAISQNLEEFNQDNPLKVRMRWPRNKMSCLAKRKVWWIFILFIFLHRRMLRMTEWQVRMTGLKASTQMLVWILCAVWSITAQGETMLDLNWWCSFLVFLVFLFLEKSPWNAACAQRWKDYWKCKSSWLEYYTITSPMVLVKVCEGHSGSKKFYGEIPCCKPAFKMYSSNSL